jgi:hypothetical protein
MNPFVALAQTKAYLIIKNKTIENKIGYTSK